MGFTPLFQNDLSSKTALLYYAFDAMVLAGEDVMGESLETRRSLLEDRVLSELDEPIRFSPTLDANLPTLIQSVSPGIRRARCEKPDEPL